MRTAGVEGRLVLNVGGSSEAGAINSLRAAVVSALGAAGEDLRVTRFEPSDAGFLAHLAGDPWDLLTLRRALAS